MRERKKQHFSMFGLELVIWYHLGARGQSEGSGGGHDIYYTFRCPECNVETDLESKKVPPLIQRELLDGGRRLVRTYERYYGCLYNRFVNIWYR